MTRASLLLVVCAAWLGLHCTPGSTEIVDRTVSVGCGICQFDQPPRPGGCYWAADFGGRVVPVRGDALPAHHSNHAPDGMCNVTRDAVVSGTLYETYFLATRFDLQPVEPAEHPRFSSEDLH